MQKKSFQLASWISPAQSSPSSWPWLQLSGWPAFHFLEWRFNKHDCDADCIGDVGYIRMNSPSNNWAYSIRFLKSKATAVRYTFSAYQENTVISMINCESLLLSLDRTQRSYISWLTWMLADFHRPISRCFPLPCQSAQAKSSPSLQFAFVSIAKKESHWCYVCVRKLVKHSCCTSVLQCLLCPATLRSYFRQ